MKVLALFCTVFLFSVLSAERIRIISADKEAEAFLKSKLTQILGQKDFSKGSLTLYVGTTWDKRTFLHNGTGPYAFLDGSGRSVKRANSHIQHLNYWYHGQYSWR